jgi:membrane protease YdiL (CAAX protease family)
VILGVALLVSAGMEKRDAFALRPPVISVGQTALTALGVLVLVWVAGAALDPVLQADEEQGLTTGDWIAGRAGPFAANFVVFALIGPAVEELLFRGIGFRLFEPYGRWTAIAATGLAFGVWHGLLNALPILIAFGLGLAYLRSRSGSIYPCIGLHALFNALAMIVSVTT